MVVVVVVAAVVFALAVVVVFAVTVAVVFVTVLVAARGSRKRKRKRRRKIWRVEGRRWRPLLGLTPPKVSEEGCRTHRDYKMDESRLPVSTH